MQARRLLTIPLLIVLGGMAGFGGAYGEHAWERYEAEKRLPRKLWQVRSRLSRHLAKAQDLSAEERRYQQYLTEHPEYADAVLTLGGLGMRMDSVERRLAEAESNPVEADPAAGQAATPPDGLESINGDLQDRVDQLEAEQRLHESEQSELPEWLGP